MSRTIIGAILFFIFLLNGEGAAAANEGSYEILLRDSVEVEGASVYLGDIALIRGDSEGVETIRNTKLGPSAAPGNYRVLRRNKLKAGLVVRGWTNIIIKGPDEIKIWSASSVLSRESMALKIKRNLMERMPWPKDKVEVAVHIPSGELLPSKGRITLDVELPRRFAFLGKESFLVKILLDDEDYKSLWVKSDIRLYTDMVLAKRPLLRNEILGVEDLAVERKLVTSLRKGIFNEVSELTGMRARRKINKGAVIMESDISMPPLLKRGSMVTILAEKGSLTISTRGKVMEKGFKGKIVRVKNVSSKKVVMAEVVDSKTVKVSI